MHDRRRARVILISPTESALTERGKRHPDLALLLTDDGWDVHYVSTTFNHTTKTQFGEDHVRRCKAELPYVFIALDVGAYRKNVSLARVRWNQRFARICHAYLKNVVREDDIVIVPSRPPELLHAVARLKKQVGLKAILDIRDVWPDALCMSSRWMRTGFGLYCDLFLRSSVSQFDRFVHVAPSFLRWLDRYAPGRQSTFIPLGYDRKRWQTARPKRRLCGTPISLVYVGLLQKQIDVRPVLDALVGRPDYRLTIIGDGGEGERFREVQDCLRRHEMHNVTLVGRVPPGKVPDYLQHQDIGIVPMITSSIPNKVFDYLAAYLPIIALGDNDTSRLVRRQNVGWCVPFQGREVGSLLDRLSAAEILEKANNVEKTRHLYARERLLATYVEVIASCIAPVHRARGIHSGDGATCSEAIRDGGLRFGRIDPETCDSSVE